MPLYEYICKACGNEHEALQKLSAAPLKDCPKCQQPELEKRISAAGFRLKGSGWYETDFKSGTKKNVVSEPTS
jgi:putative FmdB family regulatory protein